MIDYVIFWLCCILILGGIFYLGVKETNKKWKKELDLERENHGVEYFNQVKSSYKNFRLKWINSKSACFYGDNNMEVWLWFNNNTSSIHVGEKCIFSSFNEKKSRELFDIFVYQFEEQMVGKLEYEKDIMERAIELQCERWEWAVEELPNTNESLKVVKEICNID